jgi:hypothetical protein
VSNNKKTILFTQSILVVLLALFIYFYLTSTLSSVFSSVVIVLVGILIIFLPNFLNRNSKNKKNIKKISPLFLAAPIVLSIVLIPIKFNISTKEIKSNLYNVYSSVNFPSDMHLYAKTFTTQAAVPGYNDFNTDYKFYYTTTSDFSSVTKGIISAVKSAGFSNTGYNDYSSIISNGTGKYYIYLANKGPRIYLQIQTINPNKIVLNFGWNSKYQSFIDNPLNSLGPLAES